MYYVTMTDKFFTGWGPAKGKIAKYVHLCDTYDEALIVQQNAINRGDQKHVNICSNPPRYNSNKYYVQYKDKNDSGNWYKPGAW